MSIVLMLALVLVTGVSAQLADFVQVEDIEVNDIIVNGVDPIFVERGNTATVEVYFVGLEDAYDSRIEVSLGGYEYGVPRDTTAIFRVREGVRDKKTLQLEIPEDLDGSLDYTLRVDLYDGDNRVTQTFDLRIEEPRHFVNVLDVLFSPGNRVVKAGQPLFISARLENLGENIEEDVKVIATMPAFGLREETIVNELVTDIDEHADRQFFFDEEDAETTRDLVFMIPKDAQDGEYQVNVRIEYNRGHAVEEKTYTVRVEGGEQVPSTVTPTETLVVNVDTLTKAVKVGENAVFTFNVANLGQTARSFEVQVLGAESFGSVRADPQILTVGKDQTAEAFVAVTATQGAGAQSFTVRLVENGVAVKEVSLTANVQAEEASNGTFKNVLEIGFVVLLVILVILGLILVIKRLSDDNTEEPMDGQTYY